MPETRDMKASRQRMFRAEAGPANEDGSIPISFSSETDQVERWFGVEILSHAPGAMDMSRAKDGLPFLADHGRCLLGRMKNVRVEGGKGRGDVYFSSSAEAQQYRQDMLDGIRPDVSVGYDPQEETCERGVGNAPDRYTVTRWTPYEASSVMVPADTSVGVGRAKEEGDYGTEDEASYADPGYQSDKKPRYPLKTNGEYDAEKIKAAWSYIHQQKNADEYSGKELSEIEGKIIAAWKAKIDPDGPPDAERNFTATEGHVAQAPNPPAAPAGTTEEVRMTPEPVAAQQTATPEQIRAKVQQDLVSCRDLASRLGLADIADGMLREGKTTDEVFKSLFERATNGPLPTARVVDLSNNEARQYSYVKAIRGSLMAKEGIKWDGLEREVSDAISAKLPSGYEVRGGVFVPMATRSGLDSGTATAGAELKYTTYGGELIELLRNQCFVVKNGARMLNGLQGPVSFPRQAAAGTAVWVGENPGSDVAPSAAALSSVTLAPKSLMSQTPYSRQLLQQAVIDVENFVRSDLAETMARAWDLAALHGNGGNGPTGIYNQANVNVLPMGGVPSFGLLQNMITAVANSNALQGSLAWMTNPSIAGKLAQTLVAQAAGSKMIWDGPYDEGMVNGYRARATKQVAGTMSGLANTGGSEQGIVFGNWNEILIGNWGAMELLTDPYTLAGQAMVRVVAFQMVDVEVRHPGSFCVSTGATLS